MSFYSDAVTLNAMASPYGGKRSSKTISEHDGAKNVLYSMDDGSKVMAPHSIINNHCAIDFRNMINGFNAPISGDDNPSFTLYSDYKRCIESNNILKTYFDDAKNPTIRNILKWYSNKDFDPLGLSSYKIQDFIYNKYFNIIPNNYLVTLRRYTVPCNDRMFGFDFDAETSNTLNGFHKDYFCIATATTYLGEKPGNQISDICKFSYGQKWDEKTAEVEALQTPNGGLASQLTGKHGITDELMSGAGVKGNSMLFSAAVQAKGKSVNEAMAARNAYDGDAIMQQFPDKVFGPLNRVDTVTVRQAGLTFSNEFSLVFEYDLKSLQMVNPKIAMLDILANFMLLTGNYGSFWGGMTRYFGGQRNIAPAFGDPNLLRQAKYGEYISSVYKDVRAGYETLAKNDKGETSFLEALKKIAKGGIENMIGNFLGKHLGPASQSQIPKALLSGDNTGFWHITIGNPLNPFMVMGNMCVESTEVEFGNTFGPDDFPTTVKFTVKLKHGRGRDISDIQSMFNAGKGRIYQFTSDAQFAAFNAEQENRKNDFRKTNNGNGNDKPQENSGLRTLAKSAGRELIKVGPDAVNTWLKTSSVHILS